MKSTKWGRAPPRTGRSLRKRTRQKQEPENGGAERHAGIDGSLDEKLGREVNQEKMEINREKVEDYFPFFKEKSA